MRRNMRRRWWDEGFSAVAKKTKTKYYQYMPTYLYEVISTGEIIEIEHSASEAAPTNHPESGKPLRRIYTAPNLSGKYSEANTKRILSDENIAKSGFTKYVRDPISQRYNRTAGNSGPAQLRPRG